jgi:hypothetical protein
MMYGVEWMRPTMPPILNWTPEDRRVLPAAAPRFVAEQLRRKLLRRPFSDSPHHSCLVLVLALCGTVQAAQQAAQLFSPPMLPGADANLECLIVNGSSVTHTVEITALNSNGTTHAAADKSK